MRIQCGEEYVIVLNSVVEPKLCFRSVSGSDFQKVLAPEPAPAPTVALYLPFITDFILKSGFFMFFYERILT
jgi:hypothetical protein